MRCHPLRREVRSGDCRLLGLLRQLQPPASQTGPESGARHFTHPAGSERCSARQSDSARSRQSPRKRCRPRLDFAERQYKSPLLLRIKPDHSGCHMIPQALAFFSEGQDLDLTAASATAILMIGLGLIGPGQISKGARWGASSKNSFARLWKHVGQSDSFMQTSTRQTRQALELLCHKSRLTSKELRRLGCQHVVTDQGADLN